MPPPEIEEMWKAVSAMERTAERLRQKDEHDECPTCKRVVLRQEVMFKLGITTAPDHGLEDFDADPPPKHAEQKAAEYAQALEADGMDRDVALARARAAYGLTTRFQTVRQTAGRDFQKRATDHFATLRPGVSDVYDDGDT